MKTARVTLRHNRHRCDFAILASAFPDTMRTEGTDADAKDALSNGLGHCIHMIYASLETMGPMETMTKARLAVRVLKEMLPQIYDEASPGVLVKQADSPTTAKETRNGLD